MYFFAYTMLHAGLMRQNGKLDVFIRCVERVIRKKKNAWFLFFPDIYRKSRKNAKLATWRGKCCARCMDSRHVPYKGPKDATLTATTPGADALGVRDVVSGSPAVSASPAAGGRQGPRDGGSLVSVAGYVLPDAWGENFEVAGVLIADDRERELVVDNVAEHPALLDLCRRKVTATGWLAARDGRLLFTVRDFAVADTQG